MCNSEDTYEIHIHENSAIYGSAVCIFNFGPLASKCLSLDAKIVHKVQKYIDLTFERFDFEVVGRRYEFCGL